jgi:hypothetical protein
VLVSGSLRVLAAKVVERAVLALIPILTAIRLQFPATAPAKTLPQFLLLSLHAHYAVVVGLLAVAGLVADIAKEVLSAERKGRIKAVVDGLEEALFRDVPDDERYENRVTLFRADWRQSTLKTYCRSGTIYQRRRPKLRIHDNDQARNEGVGGQAWFRNTTVAAEALPDCATPCVAGNPDCQTYGVRGFMTIARAAKLRVKSRSLLATPVRDLRGKKWGVLVIDTRKPDAFTALQRTLASAFASAIGKMV